MQKVTPSLGIGGMCLITVLSIYSKSVKSVLKLLLIRIFTCEGHHFGHHSDVCIGVIIVVSGNDYSASLSDPVVVGEDR